MNRIVKNGKRLKGGWMVQVSPCESGGAGNDMNITTHIPKLTKPAATQRQEDYSL